MHGDISNPGHGYGQKIGKAILQDRKFDPPASQGNYLPSKGRGRHRVDPDNPGQGFHGPLYGQAKSFALKKRHELDAPPFKDTTTYTKAIRQVFAKGVKPELMGTLPESLSKDRRTAEETLIGIFWGYDGTAGLGTPPRFYNQIVRKISIARKTPESDNAKLFAFVKTPPWATPESWPGSKNTSMTSGGRWWVSGRTTLRWAPSMTIDRCRLRGRTCRDGFPSGCRSARLPPTPPMPR